MGFARNAYGPDRTLSTSFDREGLDIGPRPDFWGDMNQIVRRLRPLGAGNAGGGAAAQSQALRSSEPMAERPSGPQRLNPVDYSSWTPANFGHPSMSPQGVLGTYVNPMDVPLSMQGKVPTGFYADSAHSNYTYSPTVNPMYYGNEGASRRGK